MSGVAFSFSLDANVAADQLVGIEAFFGDLTQLLHDIGAEGEQSTVDRFDTNIAPDGTPWPPSQRALDTGTKTLVMHGDLRDSIHYQLDGDTAVEWGSALEYAAIHQAGGSIQHPGGTAYIPQGGGLVIFVGNDWADPFDQVAPLPRTRAHTIPMPARPFLGLSPRDEAEIFDIVSENIARAAKAGGGAG